MSLKQSLRDQGLESHRFEYADATVEAVDLGAGTDGSVDVVDGTAIVVVGDRQYDLDIPGKARVFMNNGILTIEVDR